MWETAKRNRLARRLRHATGMPDDPYVRFLVAQIAIANFPGGSDPDSILAPVADQSAIARATADFLDRRVGTINGLYRAIWGMSPRVYVAQLEARLGDEPPPAPS